MKMNKNNMPISVYKDVLYKSAKPSVTLLLETSSTKEVRIYLAKGVLMPNHKSSFPIIIHIQEGAIELNIEGTIHAMTKGDLIGLEASIIHNLKAVEDTIIRLSIHKEDQIERIQHALDTN